jgi:hypothetical protein
MTELEKRKALLRLKSEAHLKQIELLTEEIKSESKRWAKTAAVAGVAAFISYALVKRMSGGRKSRKTYDSAKPMVEHHSPQMHYPQEFSIWREVKQQLAYTLIGLAKEKLVAYLSNALKEKPSESEDL